MPLALGPPVLDRLPPGALPGALAIGRAVADQHRAQVDLAERRAEHRLDLRADERHELITLDAEGVEQALAIRGAHM